MKSTIKTGDDCISIGPGSANLWIEGVSIGSSGKDVEEPGVQNVTVKRTIFADTTNGFRIKSWARPASNGFVRGVRFVGAPYEKCAESYCHRPALLSSQLELS
ncbi:hypothetical protein Tsubulata_050996 [Turnera subulata]|uniref:Uncharacterized protein n=1 Tax=Turnera subulata TaxID=218843 RepID=A0A9Q0FVK0_9ROSI|nr:hypothetical protein Tsubulata_050996 [Turnera subulata]